MKVFVIGASGYVGSHVARRCVREGWDVHGLSRSEQSDQKLNAWGVKPVRGDITNEDLVRSYCKDSDATIFAPQLLLAPEQQAVQSILDALQGTTKTFIFTSGTGVLAQVTDGTLSEDSFGEDDDFPPFKPLTMRLETETLVRLAGQSRGVRAMVIRPPMIWGDDGCAIIQDMHKSIKKTGACCYVGAGLNLYSNVHILDLVELYMLALSKGTAGALYHAVSGELNYRAMAEGLAKAQGVAARSVTPDDANQIWGKFFASLIFRACSRSRSPRARQDLGWSPQYLDVAEMFAQPYADKDAS